MPPPRLANAAGAEFAAHAATVIAGELPASMPCRSQPVFNEGAATLVLLDWPCLLAMPSADADMIKANSIIPLPAAASAPAAPPSSAPPAGVLMKDGRAVVCCEEPTIEQLLWANGHNRSSTRGPPMPMQLEVNRSGSGSRVAWEDLWVALRKAGGYQLVRGLGWPCGRWLLVSCVVVLSRNFLCCSMLLACLHTCRAPLYFNST